MGRRMYVVQAVTTIAISLLLTPLSVHAAGINLSWDDCGAHGTANKTFACNSVTGLDRLLGSFIPPPHINQFLGLSAELHIQTAAAILPDWWKHGTGECRGTTGLSTSFDFTSGPFSCSDPFVGQAAGGFAYDVGFVLPNRARLRIQCAIPDGSAAALDSTAEYYAFAVNLQHNKATGSGSCAGCADAATINLISMQLFQPATANDDPIIALPTHTGSTTVFWQPPVHQPTATHSTSWGHIKTRYR
jgi:hypothetical protein